MNVPQFNNTAFHRHGQSVIPLRSPRVHTTRHHRYITHHEFSCDPGDNQAVSDDVEGSKVRKATLGR